MPKQSLATLAAFLLIACSPTTLDDLGLFGIRDTRTPQQERLFVVRDGETTAGVPHTLAHWANDVGAVRYRLGPQHQAYLMQGDLSAFLPPEGPPGLGICAPSISNTDCYIPVGISGDASVLHLPALAAGTLERVVDVSPFDSTKWGSFRIYDQGICSAVARWGPGLSVPPGTQNMADEITMAFDNALNQREPCNERFYRISPAEVSAIFWDGLFGPSTSGIDHPQDSIRFAATYRAQSVVGCSPMHMRLEVLFGLAGFPGTLWSTPQCAAPDSTPVPGTTDFLGVPRIINVHVDGCYFGGEVEDAIRSELGTRLGPLVGTAVRNALLTDPALWFGDAAGNVGRACSCPEDCDIRSQEGSAWPAYGQRHSCVNGSCWIQLEPRRLNLRPEGFEVVIFDNTTDPGFSIFDTTPNGDDNFTGLCGLGRDLVTTIPATSAPRTSSLDFPRMVTSGVTTDSNQCP